MSGAQAGDGGGRRVAVRLEGFAWEALEDESVRQGVSMEDLAAFAVLYYLADLDSGRISRQISRSPFPSESG